MSNGPSVSERTDCADTVESLPELPVLPEPVVPVRESPVGGRLQTYWANWDQLLADPWVVNVLKEGYRLDLECQPPLTTAPRQREYTQSHQVLLADAIGKLVQKRAVRELTLPEITAGFYSDVFLVPKKDSTELRMIHNLKSFNKNYLAKPPYFRMISLPSVSQMLRPGDFLASLDLKDAYLHVPIHPEYHKYLRFVFLGVHYEWVALPFGISVAPWLFSRITTPIVGYLHRIGIRLEAYLDDMIVANAGRDVLSRHLHLAIDLFPETGLDFESNQVRAYSYEVPSIYRWSVRYRSSSVVCSPRPLG